MENPIEAPTYQIHAAELLAALARQGLAANPLSPLLSLTQGLAPAAGLPPELAAQLGQPELVRALAIAATPDLVVVGRIGGGSVDLMELQLARCKALGNELAMVVAGADQTVLIRLFADSHDFVQWYLSHYAGKNDQTVANYIPPTVELGEFLYLLHAIDAFRIASFKGMLEYKAGQKPTMRLTEFTDSLRRSVKSRDIRWLLPAFLILTPGLDPQAFDLEAEKTRVLVEKNFLTLPAQPGGQDQVLGFGEAGQTMGVEFYRTWLIAAGFEIRIAAPAGIQAVERLFLAPTALANHWVQIQTVPSTKAKVNHQALTTSQLEQKFTQLLDQTLALPVVPLAAQAAPVQPAAAGTAARFCVNCGSPLKPDARFCKECGTKVT